MDDCFIRFLQRRGSECLFFVNTVENNHYYYFEQYLPRKDTTNIPNSDPILIVPQMMDIVVTEDDVVSMLLALKKSKSPEPDGFHPYMPKEVARAVEVPLSIIFSNSLYSCTIPTAWRKAILH